MRIVIADDEPFARDRLRALLDEQAGVEVVAETEDGESALHACAELKPDLVLLDIAMPGMDGIDVARALSQSAVDPAVVFVTAFDNFAVAAFDVAAIDYLMKPVQPDRLERALERVRNYLSGGKPAGGRAQSSHVEEFWVPDHSGLVRIAASDIQRITAERDYMRLHVGARSWLIHRTIAKLEEDLDPALFMRVHRSVILRRDTITGLYRDEAGHWTARLSDGAEQRIGRSYVEELKRFAGR
ncbi:MAG TPA: LytTR family DNA-binding domain-containing protein [Lysobacter sp.]|nr:LytTR family DNA-binding domain-containing protein [Lysobacter sp.]